MRKLLAALFICVSSVIAVQTAYADTVTFTSSDGTITLSAQLPAGQPTFVTGSGFAYYVPGFTFNGATVNGFLGFYDPAVNQPGLDPGADFGFNISNTGQSFYFSGAKLYSGSESSPTFLSGYYDGTGINNSGVSGQIAINPTPEPSALALLGTGAIAIAYASRRRLLFSR